MKKTLFLLLTIAFSIVKISAQDVIYKNNGDSIVAIVTKITDTEVSYKYNGEELINEISPNELRKIKYQSGRIQKFPYVTKIINKNLDADKYIIVYNNTADDLKLTVIGIQKDMGSEVTFPQNIIPAKTQGVQLGLGVRKGWLDHFSSFIFKVEGNKNDIVVTGYTDKIVKAMFVYIDNVYTMPSTQNTLIYENHGEFKDYFKIYNHTNNTLGINFYAMVNGEKKTITDSRRLKPRESDYSIWTHVENRKISQFFFEITQGTYNNVYFEVKDDDLFITFE